MPSSYHLDTLLAIANRGTRVPAPAIVVLGSSDTVTLDLSPSWQPESSFMGIGYLLAEFPTTWRYSPNLSSTMADSVGKYFASLLPKDRRIEQICWAFEGNLLRVWTIIDRPDFDFEIPIYEAELRFMDRFRDLECDFSVIYRFGKPLDHIAPTGAAAVYL